MALAMIEAAEADGRLAAGGTVVEYTGGSTGVSLSLICAVKGYPLHIVTSDAFAREARSHADPGGSASGRSERERAHDGEADPDMIEAARVVTARTGGFWTDQLNNHDQLAAYRTMAEEIWIETEGRIDGFVQSVGTAASLRGLAEALRRHREGIAIVAVEPSESPVLSGGPPGAHKIDGIGAGFVVPLWRDGIADRIEQVSTEEIAMALRLAREEGLFAGTSTGANVVAALRLAEQLAREATVVTVMCDTGMKYLKTYGTAIGSMNRPSVDPADVPLANPRSASPCVSFPAGAKRKDSRIPRAPSPSSVPSPSARRERHEALRLAEPSPLCRWNHSRAGATRVDLCGGHDQGMIPHRWERLRRFDRRAAVRLCA